MKYFIIAGEASGDLHGSNLVKHLFVEDKGAIIQGWGGDLMQSQGAEIIKHYRELAFMGFLEVARNIGTILRNFTQCKNEISAFQPDVIILIDFPGFNLRMAKWAKEKGYKVFYYISPQVWAWKANRVKKIRAYVDEMFVILPFEEQFYDKWNYKVHYVGHPLLDAVEAKKASDVFLEGNDLLGQSIIAMLPGSRRQEIYEVLPVMCSVAPMFPERTFVIAGLRQHEDLYASYMLHPNIRILYDQTYEVLAHADAALVTSGTATLETALFEVPEVVCYKGGRISYMIGKQLVNIKYISLVNLIMDQPLLKELIQEDLNTTNVRIALSEILQPAKSASLKAAYKQLKAILGNAGASSRAAKLMFELATKK